jgi:hypothetical protein
MEISQVDPAPHGHHKVAASIFVASLIVGASLLLSADLLKPERYEFHAGNSPESYVIYDRETGRATSAPLNAKNPTAAFSN